MTYSCADETGMDNIEITIVMFDPEVDVIDFHPVKCQHLAWDLVEILTCCPRACPC
jgi:hypothetical protein